MNAAVKATTALTPVGLIPETIDQAMRMAEIMASARLVPKHLQGDAGSCLMVIEQSMRWQMSPFATAQGTSVIAGRLMYEGKLVAAAVETSGAIEGGFDYQFAGEGDDRRITVSARRRGETNPRQMTIHLKDVRTTNEWWRKQPDQMLVYSGTRNWARRWTPSVILGVYSPEEFDRGKAPDAFDGTTIEAAAEEPAPSAAPPPEPAKPARRTARQFLENLEISLLSAQTREDYDLIAKSREVLEAQRTLKGEALGELWKILADHADRIEQNLITPEEGGEA